MQITFIGHASILVEAQGVTILSDPWWRGPCFGAQWWNYPEPRVDALDGKRIDYIYISHGHHDHFHPGTLPSLKGDAKVLVSRTTELAPFVRELGFKVIELENDGVFLAPGTDVALRIMQTYGDDTLMAISDGRELCLNLNDALHSAPAAVQSHFVSHLKQLFPTIDYDFCGYGTASHFPNCYVIPGMDRPATAARRQSYFNHQWAKLIADLEPRFGFPFAADVVFLEEDLFWANEPTHNTERPTDAFRMLYPKARVTTIDIAPGFVIRDGEITNKVVRTPLSASILRTTHSAEMERANRYGRVEEVGVQEAAALIGKSLALCQDYLRSYSGDYRFLIRFRNSSFGLKVEKKGADIAAEVVRTDCADTERYDVIYTTRLAYLKWALTRPHGDEILFVGSGGVFEYRNRSSANENLHRELMLILRTRDAPPRPRYGDSSKLTHQLKQRVKKLLGRRDTDLYDLGAWTVFKDPAPGQFPNKSRI